MATSLEEKRKRKRIVLNIEKKLQICKLAKEGRSLASLSVDFNVGKSTVHDIVKSQAKLETFQKEVEEGDCIKKRKIVWRADFEELDNFKSCLSLVCATKIKR